MNTVKKNDKSEKLPVSAIILAGGKGERIGGNKLFLSLDGIFLVESLIKKMSLIFDEVLLCVGNGESETALGAFSSLLQFWSVTVIEDRSSERGPIEGLYAGLYAMSNKWGFLIGCDMPSPQEVVIRYMWSRTANLNEEYKVSVARFDDNLMPLHAFYHKDCSYYINSLIEQIESDYNVMNNEGRQQALKRIGKLKRELKLKSFYCYTKINIIEEIELSTIPGWKKSFVGYNTDKELESIMIPSIE